MSKKRMILDDHRRLGSELKAMRDRLFEIAVKLQKVYDRDSQIEVKAELAWRSIDELRAALDNEIFAQYPSMPGHLLMQIYFPKDTNGGVK